MKFDHLVMNVDKNYQMEGKLAQIIRESGLPYQPKKGKSTKGFKATNIWIGKEYFEMISIRKVDGGGWKKEWVDAYNNGHRGLICLMLDVSNLDKLVGDVQSKGIAISKPESITIDFLFKLISKTLPWRNSYLDFFQRVPMQIGFQQMNNEKTRAALQKRMVPNATENNITGIQRIHITGRFSVSDFNMLKNIFEQVIENEDKLVIALDHSQQLVFEKAMQFNVKVTLNRPNPQDDGKELLD